MKTIPAKAVFSDPRFPLAVRRHDSHEPTELHSHDFHELVVILAGRGRHLTERGDYPITAGDVFLIRGEMAHGYADTKGMTLVNIFFDPRRLRLPIQAMAEVPGYQALFRVEPRLRHVRRIPPRLHLPPHDLARAAAMIAELSSELEKRNPGYRFATMAELMRLLLFLARRYFRSGGSERQPLQPISELLSYIEAHYPDRITLADLCRRAGMSNATLNRAFHAIMGCPPLEHVIRVRLAHAAELLRQPSIRITEAAFECGFSDANYFARQFRCRMGMSPRAWRQLHQSSSGRRP